jgi:hypothetical protein
VPRYAPACRAEVNEGGSCRAETPPASEALSSEPTNLSIHESNHPSAAPRKVSRNGKIARLPYQIRDMVNRMLRNNIAHSKIVGALDEHGITVTQRNVSNWKTRGGYREWCAQQDLALETHLAQDNLIGHLRTTDATQLSEVGLQLAATQLSQLFLKQGASEQLAADPDKFATAINALCRLNRQLYRLQKYRDDSARELGYKHNPERIKRETEEDLECTRNVYSSFIPKNAPIDPEVPHRNFIPKNPYACAAQDDPDQYSARPAGDPLRALSNLALALKNGSPSKPETRPGSILQTARPHAAAS